MAVSASPQMHRRVGGGGGSIANGCDGGGATTAKAVGATAGEPGELALDLVSLGEEELGAGRFGDGRFVGDAAGAAGWSMSMASPAPRFERLVAVCIQMLGVDW